MESSAFLDTQGWIALLHSKDTNHNRAINTGLELGRHGYSIVVTDWIIAETGNGLARTRIRHLLANSVEQLWSSANVEIVVVDRALIDRAIALYGQHRDKSWGLVDCASFIVMQDRGILEAFTSDKHFEQAGFRQLL